MFYWNVQKSWSKSIDNLMFCLIIAKTKETSFQFRYQDIYGGPEAL